jgi:phosphoglycerate dehydrogenase-like enzyme
MPKLNGLFVLGSDAYHAVYTGGAADKIAQRVRVIAPPQTRQSLAATPELLADVDVLFSGWGMPKVDEAFLDAAPNLKAIFYAAGAINHWATPAMWDRGITITTANDANAIPVAEYTLAMMILSLKHVHRLCGEAERASGFHIRTDVPGNYGATVGLVGVGTIGRHLIRLLQPFGMSVAVHDPYLTAIEADMLGVRRCGLQELFEICDVVSLHAADLPSTRGMIDGPLVRSMQAGATLINTSRGRLIREDELVEALRERPDLHAILDVTETEPLPIHSPLLTLPNLTLTPHLAGSQGRECHRMGQYMVDELDRYLAGEPLRWQVKPTTTAHTVNHELFARLTAPKPVVA